jgi:hypothetical protein
MLSEQLETAARSRSSRERFREPREETEFEVPTGITDLGAEFKFEIIARTTTNNNTAVESCFKLQ